MAGIRPSILLIVLASMLLAACTGSFPWSVHVPASLRTSTVSGVIDDIKRLPDGRDRYELRNGRSLDVDYDETDNLLGGPEAGWLLLSGTGEDGQPWIAGIAPSTAIGRPSGCFDFPAQGRANDGWIETSSGFRLPKAPDFHDPRDNPSDLYSADQGMFCLNEHGEVTSYDVR